MTKPVTIPNTFATATTAIPLSQLDSDFSTVATALNDANTYSNYAADTGVANAYVVTLTGVSTTYSAGLRIQFKAGNANTGASTLNVNAGGTKNITFQDASALSSGTIAANAIVDVMYDGTQFLLMNDPAGTVGAGDVVGPAGATANAVVRFDSTTGKLVKNSVVTIADSTGDMSGVGAFTASGNVTLGDATTDTITLTGTVQPGVVISGSSSGDALRITQTGAGNALLVEDAANPDSTPFVVGASGNVGIGTTSPGHPLTVNANPGAAGVPVAWLHNSGNFADYDGVVISNVNDGSDAEVLHVRTNNNTYNNGTSLMLVRGDGNVGIGTTSPAAQFVVSNAGAQGVEITGSNGAIQVFNRSTSAYGTMNLYANILYFRTGASPALNMTLDSSGNLGLGVTPSGWASTYRAYQVGQAGSLFGLTNDQDRVGVSSNAYFDTTDSRWEYIGTGYAMRYDQNAGEHQWYTAASGAANGAITFTQAMTLDASGNLLVGATSALVSGASRGNITVNGSSDSIVAFGSAGANTGYLYATTSGMELASIGSTYVRFSTNNTERARITSGGDFRVKGAGTAGSTDAFQVSGSAPADAARIDSSGNLLVGGTTAYGQISATKSIAPAATPSSDWGIDFASSTAPPNYISLAASATYDLGGGSGFVVLHNNNGDAAAFLTYGGVVTKLGGATTVISGTAGANQIGLTYNSGTGKYRISNGHSTTQNIFVTTIRTRTSS